MISPHRGPASPTSASAVSPSAKSVASSLESYISEFFESPTQQNRDSLDSGMLGVDNDIMEDGIDDPLERSVEDVERELSTYQDDHSVLVRDSISNTNPYGKQAQRQRRQKARLQDPGSPRLDTRSNTRLRASVPVVAMSRSSHHSKHNVSSGTRTPPRESSGGGGSGGSGGSGIDHGIIHTKTTPPSSKLSTPPSKHRLTLESMHHASSSIITAGSANSPRAGIVNTIQGGTATNAAVLVHGSAVPNTMKSLPPSSPMSPGNQHHEKRIRLKCHWKNGIRVVNATRSTTFQTMKQRLEADYGFQVSLRYEDPEGDLITLSSQNDLIELIESCPTIRGSVTVHVSQASRLPVSSLLMSPTPSASRLHPIHNMPSLPRLSPSGEINNNSSGDGGGDDTQSSHLHQTQAPTHVQAQHANNDPPPPMGSATTPDRTHLRSPRSLTRRPLYQSSASPSSHGIHRSLNMSSSLSVLSSQSASSAYWHSKPRQVEPIRWQRGEVIGQGAYGTVFLGLNLDTGELMAVKQLDAKEVSEKELAVLENELRLLIGLSSGSDSGNNKNNLSSVTDSSTNKFSGIIGGLNHPNIVRYLGMERTKVTLSIFLEYVPGGSIRSLIDRFGALQEPLVRVYSRQLLLGLEYLHRNGIAHRDIKGANVLITNDGIVKLADFGASKRINTQNSYTQSGVKGTPLWMAPEVIKEQQTDKGWRRADVWSVGCTVIEMATGRPPWSQYSNPVTAMYHIACVETVPPFPETLSPQGHAFLKRCFVRDPAHRPTVTDLLLDPFVTQLPAAQVRHLSNTSFPQRPTTGGRRRGSGRPRSSQYHMMSSSVQRLSRDCTNLPSKEVALANSISVNEILAGATGSGTSIVSPSPLTVPNSSPPAAAGQTSGETVRERNTHRSSVLNVPDPIRLRNNPKGTSHSNSQISDTKKKSRKKVSRGHKQRRNQAAGVNNTNTATAATNSMAAVDEPELTSTSSLITHAVIATPRVSLFNGIESDDDEIIEDDDQLHLGGMGGLRIRTHNDELVAADQVEEENIPGEEREGPPTPKELLAAANRAAASGSALNLADHDSPRNFPTDSMSAGTIPPAVSVPMSDRSPRPDEDEMKSDGDIIAEEVVEEMISGGGGDSESGDEDAAVEEAIMANDQLTDELNEFREQLGITPRHAQQHPQPEQQQQSIPKKNTNTSDESKGYQYSASPMTPRRRQQQQHRQKSKRNKAPSSSSKQLRSGNRSAMSRRSDVQKSPPDIKKRPQSQATRTKYSSPSSNSVNNSNANSIERRKYTATDDPRLSARKKLSSVRRRNQKSRSELQQVISSNDMESDSLDEESAAQEKSSGEEGKIEQEDEQLLIAASNRRRKPHPKTSRAASGRRRGNKTGRGDESRGGAKSPDLWVSQRRQRMSYDREGLKTAGPSSRPSSKGSEDQHQKNSNDAQSSVSSSNSNGHRVTGSSSETVTVIARSQSTSGPCPSSMAVGRSNLLNVSSESSKGIRALAASPMHVQGSKHQLGVLRGKKMHNRASSSLQNSREHHEKPLPLSASKKRITERSGVTSATKRSNRKSAELANFAHMSNLRLSAAAHGSATSIQRWIRSMCPNLGTKTMNMKNNAPSTSPVGRRGLSSSSSKKRRRSFPSEYNSQHLPSFMRLLETQPTSPSAVSSCAADTHTSGNGDGDATEDSAPGVRSRILTGHTSTISGLCVLKESTTGSKVAFSSASLDGSVRLWDPQTGESLCTLLHRQNEDGNNHNDGPQQPSGEQEQPVSVLALDATSERSPMLYSGAADGSLWSWDAALGKLTKRIRQAHSGPITSLKVAAMETSRVVTGSADNTVKIWDMRQKRPLVYTLRGHSAPVTSLQVESAWGRVFSGSKDQSLRVWDIRTGRQTHALQDHFGSVQCVVTSPQILKGYVSGARDSSIKFWNREGQCMRTIRAHKGVVYAMALQPLVDGVGGGLMVGSGMNGGGMSGLNNGGGMGGMSSGMSSESENTSTTTTTSNLMDDTMMITSRGGVLGPLLASGGADGKVKLWDCTRKKCVSELEGHRGAVYACKWAGPECVVSASADSTVRAWDINSGRCLTLSGHTSAVTDIHCDKDCILSASKDATLRLWSVGIAFGL